MVMTPHMHQDAHLKKMQSSLRNMEHESADLKFLNTQYAHKLRVQEQDGELKAERIQRLLEKNLEAVVETADGKRRHIATRRQRMELKSLVDPADPRDIPPPRHRATAAAGGHHHQADLLQLADKKIAALENQLATVTEDKVFIDASMATLQAQVQRREDEIERMGRLLEGGRPVSSVLADGHLKTEERKLATLENQVQYLQESKKALEAELTKVGASNEELSLHVEEMQSKNGTMIRELANFDRLSRELQQEKLAAKAASARDLRKERAALQRQKENLSAQLNSLQTVEHAKTRLEGENEHLAANLSKSEREVEKLQSKLNRTVDDSGRLEATCQRLLRREKELVAQLRRSGEGPSRTSIQTVLAPGGTSRGDGPSVDTKTMQAVIVGLTDEAKALEVANRSLQQAFVSVEQERDYFKHEAAKASSGRSRGGRSSSGGGGGVNSNGSSSFADGVRSAEPGAQEIQRYQAESMQLAKMVKRLEFQFNDASSELALLRVEHDSLRSRHQQAASKQSSSGDRYGGGGGGGGRSPDRSGRTQNARAEGAQANASVLKQHEHRHEHQLEQHMHNQVLLRAALADRQAMEGTIDKISIEAEQLRASLEQSQREGTAAETKASHLEALMLASMASGTPLQQQSNSGGGGGGVVGSDSVVSSGTGTAPSPAALHAERVIAEMTEELITKRARCSAAEAEIEKLRHALQSLHADRDSLVAEADQQSVTVNQLKQQLQAKDADTVDGGAALHAAQEEVAGLQVLVREQEHDAAQLQQRCGELTHERDEVRANAEGLDSAIQGAHLDLDNMTREHQAVHAEYHRALAERTEMERELGNANARNDAVEQMLEEKAKENDALLTTLQSQASAADSEAAGALQQELDVQSNEIDQLRRQLMEATATRLEADRLRVEIEAMNTARSIEIAQLQDMVGSAQSSQQTAADDAQVAEQLATLFARNEQLQSELREKEAALVEATQIRIQSDTELESNQALELEDLLTESRSEHAKAAIQAQNLTAENTALRRTVKEMTGKVGSLLSEVHELREVKTRGDQIASVLRSELANQRYEVTLAARQGNAPAVRDSGAASGDGGSERVHSRSGER